jgi:hypothetical protein
MSPTLLQHFALLASPLFLAFGCAPANSDDTAAGPDSATTPDSAAQLPTHRDGGPQQAGGDEDLPSRDSGITRADAGTDANHDQRDGAGNSAAEADTAAAASDPGLPSQDEGVGLPPSDEEHATPPYDGAVRAPDAGRDAGRQLNDAGRDTNDAGPSDKPYAFPSEDTFPSEDSFYRPPPLNGRAGDVIRSRTSPFTLDILEEAAELSVTARQVLYQSADALGQPMAVSGTILVPTAAWTGPGGRPLISYAVGTRGLGDACAPSYTLSRGVDYEDTTILSLIEQGWAVAVSDYQGSGTPGLHTYMVGRRRGMPSSTSPGPRRDSRAPGSRQPPRSG